MRRVLVAVFVIASSLFAQQKDNPQDYFRKLGHSAHGEAFDSGPRQKPWSMEGIGRTHFPITTSNPEVQKWFDQGHTLLHSFWFYEAERAFRWCLKLEPDNAMAYWGLARAAGNRERGSEFMGEAAKRKNKISERERLYIEAWEHEYDDQLNGDQRSEKKQQALERIVLKYPEDVEAKSLLGLEHLKRNRVGTDLLMKQVLARDPEHPGAHHYRIHNWDGDDGAMALDSCATYGRVAPYIGHAQHMPGHIYSGVGMWHEAAIAMDAATRVELSYMRRRLAFPFNTWNYGHNRNYLSYIQEQLGMVDAAIRGAKQLVAAPLDPKYSDPERYGTHRAGRTALLRALIKFERWQELLDAKTIPWGQSLPDRIHKNYAEAMAHLGLNELHKAAKSIAAHAALKKEVEKPENKWFDATYTVQALELKALMALAKGETLNGLGALADAAARESVIREEDDDPPSYPNILYNTLGFAYLKNSSPALAVKAFEKALEAARNDGFALSGLVRAHAALGEKDKARDAMARLLFVWSGADAGLKWLEQAKAQAKATGIEASPRDSSPGTQRNYRALALNHFGPSTWEPYEAPQFEALDAKGKPVTLKEFAGRNVLLIFYIGGSCPHCVEQLVEANKRKAELSKLDTDVVAASSDTPETIAKSLKDREIAVRLLSDPKYENARRFKSYDDFEEIPLHSTILIDKRGRVHWARNGGAPFTDFDFLMKEIKRLNDLSVNSQPAKK